MKKYPSIKDIMEEYINKVDKVNFEESLTTYLKKKK